uniref:Evasin n=1 Tax=Amblyomma triste TaxID=251400 RepID=A0A023G2I5_AMBTT
MNTALFICLLLCPLIEKQSWFIGMASAEDDDQDLSKASADGGNPDLSYDEDYDSKEAQSPIPTTTTRAPCPPALHLRGPTDMKPVGCSYRCEEQPSFMRKNTECYVITVLAAKNMERYKPYSCRLGKCNSFGDCLPTGQNETCIRVGDFNFRQ